MFIVMVTYTAPLADVEQWRSAHAEWLRDLISRRQLLMAGRQVPLTGGVYLAPAMPIDELHGLLATDPYILQGVAAHDVVEFTPALAATGLEDLVDQQ